MLRSHAALDVGAEFREQGIQHTMCGNNMATKTRIRVYRSKRLLQKIHADAFSATDLLQCRRLPGLPFHHFCQQGQADRNHLAILRQSESDIIHKLLLLRRQIGGVRRQLPKCLTEPDQHFPGVVNVEQIHEQKIPAGYDLDIQCLHQPLGGDIEIITHHHNRL